MKYPIGIQTFEKIISGGYVYVDKTALIYRLVKDGSIYFLGRPRRFGKSLLMSTIKAYYQGKKHLFAGLAMEQLEKDWKKYPVFHIDFNGKNFTEAEILNDAIRDFLNEAEKEYNITDKKRSYGDRLKDLIVKASKQYGRRAVVLVDEYDKPLLDVMGTPLEATNREILKGFYSTFKLADEYLQFVMLTGVTKFSQISVFSGFNQPKDISMSSQYEALCGITEDELISYFTEPIQQMAKKYGMTLDDIKSEIKQMYDGYHFSEDMTDIYNPYSLLNALDDKRLDTYWYRTATPTYLVKLMENFNDNIEKLVSKSYAIEEFIDYHADEQLPLPMLYQSGYLTIKGYNLISRSYKLDFPNNEVKGGFLTLIANSYLKCRESSSSWCVNTVNALVIGDLKAFRDLMTSFFASIPYSQRSRGNEQEQERDFQYTFYPLLRMISSYLIYIEKQTSEGRADCVIETPNYIYIFEFKRNGRAAEALAQINEKGYAREYAADARKLYKIGCSYNSATGTIDDWAEEENTTAIA